MSTILKFPKRFEGHEKRTDRRLIIENNYFLNIILPERKKISYPKVFLVDISKGGLAFDLREDEGFYRTGDELLAEIVLDNLVINRDDKSRKLSLVIKLKVVRIEETIEKYGEKFTRHGCRIVNTKDVNFKATMALIDFLNQLDQVSLEFDPTTVEGNDLA